jgi:uncharacterized cupin superfamily protein
MSSTRIVDFREAANEETAPVDAARVLAGAPVATTRNHHADDSNRFFAGVWSSTPGKWRIRYTAHEFCHLIEGRVRLVGDDGAVREFGPGDAWVIPAGFVGSWETIEAARKHYAIFDPGS